ncbi:hypothetical protein BFP72_14805 [Reichenbachiella sp. 5M10]|uniref:hypothetical protein n=1 Tax=Reichenbachiella sp. 5M10 TaxID=1889772 RepID=UPI000C14C490|nr:hypothetical protein [Reichenbachiella sp. 5M10]PIB36579.1 hypothetical protein BFP72_14805 [Reichenbachiella sp. 5M10]
MDYNSRITVLVHKGNKIFYHDFSDLRADEHQWILEIGFERMLRSNPSQLFIVSNIKNTKINDHSKQLVEGFLETLHDKRIGIKNAVFGLSAVQRVILSNVEKNTFFAADLDEALEWLTNS